MKITTTLFLLLLIATLSSAQYLGSIDGKFIDKGSKDGIPFASISLHQLDSNVVGGVDTDFDGYFKLNAVKPGEYLLKFHTSFYKDTTIHVTLKDGLNLSVTAIYLTEDKSTNAEFEVIEYKVPMIHLGRATSGATVTRESRKAQLIIKASSIVQAALGSCLYHKAITYNSIRYESISYQDSTGSHKRDLARIQFGCNLGIWDYVAFSVTIDTNNFEYYGDNGLIYNPSKTCEILNDTLAYLAAKMHGLKGNINKWKFELKEEEVSSEDHDSAYLAINISKVIGFKLFRKKRANLYGTRIQYWIDPFTGALISKHKYTPTKFAGLHL